MGAGQSLQPAILLAYGLAAQAAVELCLLHALVEAHDVGAQLPLQTSAAVDALAQAVKLELAQLGPVRPGERDVGVRQVSASEQLPCFPPCPAQEALPTGPPGGQYTGLLSWLHSCLAGGPRKNVLPSLGLGFPSSRKEVGEMGDPYS